jgi:hypothetical protein
MYACVHVGPGGGFAENCDILQNEANPTLEIAKMAQKTKPISPLEPPRDRGTRPFLGTERSP